MRNLIIKKVKKDWQKNFENQLDIAERKEISNVARYFRTEYFKGIDEYLSTKRITSYEGLFKESDVSNIYNDIYVNIGLRFTKWYQRNFEKLIDKQTTDFSIWEEKYSYIASKIAAERVVSVSGNRKKELRNVLQRLVKNPDFNSMNERQQQRILRQKFNGLSKTNAQRIVRTESTLAANYATQQTAIDTFGINNLQKEWFAALDSRVRPDHAAANGQVVDQKDYFKVGGEELMMPGDSNGSAANVINCRCSSASFPKPEPETVQSNLLEGLAYAAIAGEVVQEIIE
jgi:uncharacterized protein with gpF-like domain